MPISIETLPVVSLDYTKRGPGLHVGLKQLERMLDAGRGREGHLAVNGTVTGEVIPSSWHAPPFLGPLKGIVPTAPARALAARHPELGQASKGKDMSREITPSLRVGFLYF